MQAGSLSHWPLTPTPPDWPPCEKRRAPARPCTLRVWGRQLGADWVQHSGQPPRAASGSETAYSCPRDANGKGGHLARLVSCGVSPAQSPGPGQSHSHPRAQKVWVLHRGALPRRCPAARAASPVILYPWGSCTVPREGHARAAQAWGRGGPWASGTAVPRLPRTPARPAHLCLNTWPDAAPGRVSPRHGHPLPPSRCSQSAPGVAPAGAPPPPPPA